ATVDVEDMFPRIALQEEDEPQFAFPREGVQCTLNRLPRGSQHCPAAAPCALAKTLGGVKIPAGVSRYQCTADSLMGGERQEAGREASSQVCDTLTSLGLELPPAKWQGPRQEVKFGGVWWLGGAVAIPADIQEKKKKKAGKAPERKREQQQIPGMLSYWREHVPRFSIIAQPLYHLIKKNAQWQGTSQHEEALNLL
ncbi:TF28 protein, partial [Halcyon senegalensis]|nr:TF28 protein [Halcyon senegalensis]